MGPLAWTPADFFLTLACAVCVQGLHIRIFAGTDGCMGSALCAIRLCACSLTSKAWTIASVISWYAWCEWRLQRYRPELSHEGTKELAPRMRCSQCGKKADEVVAVAKPTPPKDPHCRSTQPQRSS